MNLVNGKWIPVLNENDNVERVSLETLFQNADEIRDFSATPPIRIALLRLLLCITHAALDGPKDENDWRECKTQIAEKSIQYLETKKTCFEFYGDRPFMQVPTLLPIYNTALDKLDFSLASGNNSVLFDHEASNDGRDHDDGWIALMMLSSLLFSPGGKIGVTKWGDVYTQPGKTKGPGESEHAPCLESSALHTFIRGENILETIHANLLTKEIVNGMANMSWGCPTWEIDVSTRNNETLQSSVTTYLGRLVPLTRAILLEKNNKRCSLANGLSYPKLPECREVSATVFIDKKDKTRYVSINVERHPWRELNSILSFGQKQGGPLALERLKKTDDDKTIDIWTGGLAADKGKIIDNAEWSFAIPLKFIGNDGVIAEYTKGVQHAQYAENILTKAIKKYSDFMKLDKSPAPKARNYFWSMLDSNYEILLNTTLDSTVTLDEKWTPFLRQAIEEAYSYACPCMSPRQIQAFALGQSFLRLKNSEKKDAQKN